jgi:hypothetical protein
MPSRHFRLRVLLTPGFWVEAEAEAAAMAEPRQGALRQIRTRGIRRC